jgi:putative ABC transport system permease protein
MRDIPTPGRLRKLVRLLLADEDREFLLADLDEEYRARRAAKRPAAAWYLAQGLHAAWTRRTLTHSKGSLTMALWQDITFAVRSLSKQRGFTLVALLTLALGIGANTAVFSVIRHVLMAPLPYRDADRVVVVWSKWKGFDKTWVSDAEALDYQKRVAAFSHAAAWSVQQVNLTSGDEPVRIGAAAVTPSIFDVLGVEPVIGRRFTAAEAEAASPTVVMLSYGLWQRRFAASPAVLNQPVTINGRTMDVVGVMPKDFQLPTDYVVDAEEPTQLWLPLRLNPANRGSHGYYAAARLRPGATVAGANAELEALAGTLVTEGLYPPAMEFRAFAVTTTDEAFASVRPALLLVLGAVAFLLLIASVNVANLLLVRADARTREMAVRTALGARRWRLVRQLLTEGAVLAAAAAVMGVGLAAITLKLLVAHVGTSLPRGGAVALDGRALAFSAALTLVTLVLFSLVPAIRAARVDLIDSLRDGSQNASAGVRKHRLRGALVVVEMALAVTMLVGAGLMLRSLWTLQRVDLGFNPARVLTMRLALPAATYDTPEKTVGFYEQLIQRVRALPGVERAGYLRLLPLASQIGDWGLLVEGYVPPPGVGTPGDWQVATAGGPEARGEKLIAGRWLNDQDTIGHPDVALINEAMAKKYWAGRDPIGHRFRMGDPTRPWIEVVGVVGNVRHNGIEAEIKPKFYRPLGQFHQSTGNPARNTTLVIKTAGDPMALVPAVRAEIRQLDRQLPIAAIRSMEDVVNQSIATPRLTGWLLGVFASLALALAAVGIYGVLSYVVSQRRQEIGIRLAIGASRRQVLAMVLGSGLTLAAAGVIVGLALAGVATQLMTALLHDVKPLDPLTFAVVPVLLFLVAIGACLVPAVRATRVSPVSALRAE